MGERAGLNEDFRDMLASLLEAGVEFLVVGAHALAFHGLPRATGDIDILVRPTKENASRVVRALQAFGAPLSAHGVTEADFSTAGTVYQLGLPPRRIDLLTAIDGVSFEEAWADRVVATRDGLELSFLSREALVKNKRAAARPKDFVDVEALEKLET